jgi:hypothetical protein
MEPDLEPEIRNLAYHIWQTAGRDFSHTALDFWAMAERMIIEMTADSVRRTNTVTAAAVETAAAWPAALGALYRYRVRAPPAAPGSGARKLWPRPSRPSRRPIIWSRSARPPTSFGRRRRTSSGPRWSSG